MLGEFPRHLRRTLQVACMHGRLCGDQGGVGLHGTLGIHGHAETGGQGRGHLGAGLAQPCLDERQVAGGGDALSELCLRQASGKACLLETLAEVG